MAYSYVRYTSNGTTTNYTFSFQYIDPSHIEVRVDGTQTSLFTFLNTSTISLASAPLSGAIIEIRRTTPKDSPIVNFQDGSILLERDLDLLATYNLYLAQETKDSLESSMLQDSVGVWQAQNKRIAAVADPVNPQDVATKGWSETAASAQVAQATSQATASAASATASAASAITSATQAGVSTTKASEAQSSATAASGSATAAASSATSAATSASSASTSAATATTKASEAAASATTASAAATTATDQATASASSAVSAASSAASAAALLDNFDDRYLGSKATDPTVDNDGNTLVLGALYFNSTNGKMRVYTSSGWLDTTSALVASLVTYEYVATAGQTVFTGADANGLTLGYTVSSILVTLNGVNLRPGDDFTATSGTSLTLNVACDAGDELMAYAFNNFSVANAYTKAEVDAALTNVVKTNVVSEFTAQQYAAEVTLTDAATVAWNVANAQVSKVTLAGNRTFGAPTNQKAGSFYGLMVVQDATGSRTGAWNSVFKFPAATTPTLTTSANAKDFFVFRSDGTNMYLVGKSMDVR